MVSFDIFDTLVTRNTYLPSGIFLSIQRKLCNKRQKYGYLCDTFSYLRSAAEEDARLYAEQKGIEDITLDEIYTIFSERAEISNELIEDLKKIEIETEEEYIYPIIPNIKLVKEYLGAGEKVILISDMYLSKDIIRKMLVSIDTIFSDLTIYVSCDERKAKHSGSLFFEISKREKESFDTWIHYGDNKHSDYLMPKMLGIDAKYFNFEPLTLWEKELLKGYNFKDDLIIQLYLGIARNIRLGNHLNIETQIGASFGGIVLYPYVQWVVNKSAEMGIRRLYFIARDGYVLKKIADLIIRYLKLDIVTKYIFGSRKAWNVNETSEQEKKLITMYLRQEVDFSDSRFAFVELHGTGNTLKGLAEIILKEFNRKTNAFYFDLLNHHSNEYCNFMPFSSEHSGKIELFCRAPHGVTIGYTKKDNKVIPEFQKIEENVSYKKRLANYVNGIELFAQMISKYAGTIETEGIKLTETAIRYLDKEPCKELLDFVGEISHSNDMEDKNAEYAPILTRKDIFKLYMWRTIEDISEFYQGTDLRASLLRTNLTREKGFFEKHYNDVLGRTVHRIKNFGKKYKVRNIKNVIIYAAGNLGKRLYQHLITTYGFYVVGWTDVNYEQYKKAGLSVIPLLEALKLDFDYVIIAVAEPKSCGQIRKILEELNVGEEKILSYKDFVNKYLYK